VTTFAWVFLKIPAKTRAQLKIGKPLQSKHQGLVTQALDIFSSPALGSADLFTWNGGAWVGMGYKAVFAANIGNICKKTNAVDRPSQVITNRAE
jgi:hypothetical protein